MSTSSKVVTLTKLFTCGLHHRDMTNLLRKFLHKHIHEVPMQDYLTDDALKSYLTTTIETLNHVDVSPTYVCRWFSVMHVIHLEYDLIINYYLTEYYDTNVALEITQHLKTTH